jgi:hypothetical protein
MRLFSTIGIAFTVLVAVLLLSLTGEAHVAVTTKYTYNNDVYPVFLNRCGHCHVAGGVGPMSLLRYEDAFPWAESFRVELLDAADHEPADFIKAAHRDLSARELNVVLDWANGGFPEGDHANAPAAVALKNDWASGKPDLVLRPSAPFDVPADATEVTQEFVLPSSLTRNRQVSAVDLLPGTPAVVRDVTITVRTAGTPPKTIGTWVPRQTPAPIVVKPSVDLPPGAEIVARVHYKKTWKFEGQAVKDRSSVGIYFADK